MGNDRRGECWIFPSCNKRWYGLRTQMQERILLVSGLEGEMGNAELLSADKIR